MACGAANADVVVPSPKVVAPKPKPPAVKPPPPPAGVPPAVPPPDDRPAERDWQTTVGKVLLCLLPVALGVAGRCVPGNGAPSFCLP